MSLGSVSISEERQLSQSNQRDFGQAIGFDTGMKTLILILMLSLSAQAFGQTELESLRAKRDAALETHRKKVDAIYRKELEGLRKSLIEQGKRDAARLVSLEISNLIKGGKRPLATPKAKHQDKAQPAKAEASITLKGNSGGESESFYVKPGRIKLEYTQKTAGMAASVSIDADDESEPNIRGFLILTDLNLKSVSTFFTIPKGVTKAHLSITAFGPWVVKITPVE